MKNSPKKINNIKNLVIALFALLTLVFTNSSIADSSNQLFKMSDYLGYLEAPIPSNGAIQVFSNESQIAPLKIVTTQGANYLVKLVSVYSQKPVMTVFIRGGNTVTTKVPLGSYTIKYASGDDQWYGYTRLFGKQTQYSKADTTFTFENTGYQISGYTISLYRVSNGNLSTSSINPSDF